MLSLSFDFGRLCCHLRPVKRLSLGYVADASTCAGENSIMIVGGANTADWDFNEGALQVDP